ncbi:MAG: hypothetical protein H5T96_04290 [Tissierellales bacterium]|nr:hypothetical protein [Tissierellales bacterium]
MKEIDKLFLKYAENVAFVQLKEDKSIKIQDTFIDSSIPLPIVTEIFIEDLKKDEILEDIPLERIIQGMAYIIGADPEFKYNDKYIDFLSSIRDIAMRYIFKEAISYFDKKSYKLSALYFRTLTTVFPDNDNFFYYALAIEAIGKELIEQDKIEEGNKFIVESKNILENIIDKSTDYYPAYYKLGYYYKYFNEFIKAKITWEKALRLDNDENRKNEIRLELEYMERDYTIELAIWQINNLNYEKAIDELSKLVAKGKDDYYVNYLLGIAYSGYGNLELSKQYLLIALDKNDKDSNVYNELGIVYFNQGNIKEAVNIFTEGLKRFKDDYRLYFNRGLGYLNLGETMKGYFDIKKANELNNDDENIRNQLKEIEKFITDMGEVIK